jgi:2-dehydro-3-deoxyphosphogluconate aldolase/(4S)-4-hydroxy-2-oxoglutarate aldolase
VDEANISAWFKAGVCAVGLGSKVISKEALANKDYAAIERLITEAMDIVKRY